MFDLGGVDWSAALNSNLGGLIVSGTLGVLLASFIQVVRETRADGRKRKRLALLLGYEIAQMRQIALESARRNRTLLEEYREEVASEANRFLTFNDMDLSRTAYDNPNTDLTLMPEDLIPSISDIYRRVELCNHIKRLANSVSVQGANNLAVLLADPGNAPARREANEAARQLIMYGDTFLTNLGNLTGMCAVAVAELSKIAKIDESKVYRVTMVGAGDPSQRQGGT